MMKKMLCRAVLILSVFGCLSAFADFASDKKAELQHYIEVFNDEYAVQAQKDACNELQWKGITEVQLYDSIEKRLNAILPSAVQNKADMETAAWFAKGLGSSGMEKYRPTLERMVSTHQKKLVRYAQEGLAKLAQYKKWNPIIADEKNFRSDQSLQVNRFANILKSGDAELKLIGIKRVHYEHLYNEYLLDILRDELMASYALADTSRDRGEMYKWFIKAIAGSRNMKYLSNLREVEAKTPNRKLKGYATKTINGYYGR
jgi:hypothetical protein